MAFSKSSNHSDYIVKGFKYNDMQIGMPDVLQCNENVVRLW